MTEGASAEVRCPQIDTQQLDCLIKAIIAEVISFFKVSRLTAGACCKSPR